MLRIARYLKLMIESPRVPFTFGMQFSPRKLLICTGSSRSPSQAVGRAGAPAGGRGPGRGRERASGAGDASPLPLPLRSVSGPTHDSGSTAETVPHRGTTSSAINTPKHYLQLAITALTRETTHERTLSMSCSCCNCCTYAGNVKTVLS